MRWILWIAMVAALAAIAILDFGVHNYVGWFYTVFVFMLVYFLVAQRTTEAPRAELLENRRWLWALPAIYYGLMTLNAARRTTTERPWR